MEPLFKVGDQAQSIREMVYDTLREAILSGRISPGSRLKERDIAGQLGVSTTPLKEALRLLHQEGLVVTLPRRGTFVSNHIMTSIEEVTWARSALEGVAARLAALKITDDECRELEAVIKQMRVLTDKRDFEQLLVMNETFHEMIREIARNDYVIQQVTAVRAYDQALRQKALSDLGELERAYADHHLIFEKITNRDADGAEDAMRNHIRRTMLFVRHHVNGEQKKT